MARARAHRVADAGRPRVGGDPVLLFTSTCPVPPQSEAWLFAGFLRGEALDVIPGRTVDLEVPAAAEIVFEGFVDPLESPEPCGRGSRGNGFSGEPFTCPSCGWGR